MQRKTLRLCGEKQITMKSKLLLTTIILLFTSVAFSQQKDFQTLTYFQNDSLNLDLFLPDGYDNAKPLPIVIYVFGGGFSVGQRENGHGFARYLVKNNIACASISYTRYMKGKKRGFGCNGITSEKMKAMQIAVSQLWHATAFVINNSREFNIDTTKIFIAGSSAGAETSLHAPYWNREQMQLFGSAGLPADFCYAGVIGGAGAITDINLITCDNMVPMMFFHGDKDKLVPYGTAAHHFCDPTATGWLMMFGSHSIAERLKELNGICEMITVKGGGHECAGKFIHQDQQVVVDFINRVLSGEHFIYEITMEK